MFTMKRKFGTDINISATGNPILRELQRLLEIARLRLIDTIMLARQVLSENAIAPVHTYRYMASMLWRDPGLMALYLKVKRDNAEAGREYERIKSSIRGM